MKLLTGSCKKFKIPSKISGSIGDICLWQPSPTADIAIKAACLKY